MSARRMFKVDMRRQALMQLADCRHGFGTMRVADAMQALRRLKEGTYGICVDCAETIPDIRLEARPEAIRCIGCQQRHDQYVAA